MENLLSDLTVIVPVRNSEQMVESCLESILNASPAEVIVVDGCSTDRTLEILQRYPVRVISDQGLGVSTARNLGVAAARTDYLALIDVDIVLGDRALQNLFTEFLMGKYDALQAGLVSTGGPGYWGQALVNHHNSGRSKHWPGLMATIFKREVLLHYPLEERFRSGEDIELRWRLSHANLKLGVSSRTLVTHRFEDTYEFAKGQWLADGKGLGRMWAKYGWQAAHLLAIPAAGSVRGILLSIARLQPKWIPYFLGYLVYNYAAMPTGMGEAWLRAPTRTEGERTVRESF